MISNCPHNVLNPVKINDKCTKLVCTSCNVVIGWWLDEKDGNRLVMDYTDEERLSMR